jgi:hypothetical protein
VNSSKSAERRALKKAQRCETACCSHANFRAVYREATLRGAHDVDHIVPLEVGALLASLGVRTHCVSNLQPLPDAVHRIKTSKIDQPLISSLRRALRKGLIDLSQPPRMTVLPPRLSAVEALRAAAVSKRKMTALVPIDRTPSTVSIDLARPDCRVRRGLVAAAQECAA